MAQRLFSVISPPRNHQASGTFKPYFATTLAPVRRRSASPERPGTSIQVGSAYLAKELEMSVRNKFTRSAIAAVSLLTLASAPTLAADAIESVRPVAPMEEPPLATWSGPYAGIQLGYGFAGKANEPGNEIDTDGFVGGGFAGYNAELGNGIVAGVEGDVNYSGIKGDNAGTSVKSGVDGSLRGRLGYAVTPRSCLM
jgi:hypothetical protein